MRAFEGNTSSNSAAAAVGAGVAPTMRHYLAGTEPLHPLFLSRFTHWLLVGEQHIRRQTLRGLSMVRARSRSQL